MQIDPKSLIGGVPLVTVRHLFRRAGFHPTLAVEFVSETLNLNGTQARGLIEALAKAGFLERVPLPPEATKLWQLTKDGIRLRASTAARPLHRKTADLLLSGLVDRIRLLNSDRYYLARVRRAVVFGSYLSEAARIGDVDVAIELVRREADYERHKAANSSGLKKR